MRTSQSCKPGMPAKRLNQQAPHGERARTEGWLKCRRRSDSCPETDGSFDTLFRDRDLGKQNSFVFNQLSRSGLERILAGELHHCVANVQPAFG